MLTYHFLYNSFSLWLNVMYKYFLLVHLSTSAFSGCKIPMVNEWIHSSAGMKTDCPKPKYPAKNLYRYHFVHQKFHVNYPRMPPGHLRLDRTSWSLINVQNKLRLEPRSYSAQVAFCLCICKWQNYRNVIEETEHETFFSIYILSVLLCTVPFFNQPSDRLERSSFSSFVEFVGWCTAGPNCLVTLSQSLSKYVWEARHLDELSFLFVSPSANIKPHSNSKCVHSQRLHDYFKPQATYRLVHVKWM